MTLIVSMEAVQWTLILWILTVTRTWLTVNCQTVGGICTISGEYKPDQYDCSAYFFCSKGTWERNLCENILVFNPKINSCDDPEKYPCIASTTTAPEPTTTPQTTTTSSEILPQNGTFLYPWHQVIPDAKTETTTGPATDTTTDATEVPTTESTLSRNVFETSTSGQTSPETKSYTSVGGHFTTISATTPTRFTADRSLLSTKAQTSLSDTTQQEILQTQKSNILTTAPTLALTEKYSGVLTSQNWNGPTINNTPSETYSEGPSTQQPGGPTGEVTPLTNETYVGNLSIQEPNESTIEPNAVEDETTSENLSTPTENPVTHETGIVPKEMFPGVSSTQTLNTTTNEPNVTLHETYYYPNDMSTQEPGMTTNPPTAVTNDSVQVGQSTNTLKGVTTEETKEQESHITTASSTFSEVSDTYPTTIWGTPMSSAPSNETTDAAGWLCLNNAKEWNLTQWEIELLLNEIAQFLLVDPRSTSAYKRKFMSSPDSRPSSTGMGVFGLTFCISVVSFIALSDFLRLCVTRKGDNKKEREG